MLTVLDVDVVHISCLLSIYTIGIECALFENFYPSQSPLMLVNILLLLFGFRKHTEVCAYNHACEVLSCRFGLSSQFAVWKFKSMSIAAPETGTIPRRPYA